MTRDRDVWTCKIGQLTRWGGNLQHEVSHTICCNDSGDNMISMVSKWWDGGQTTETITANHDNQRMPDKNNFNGVLEMDEKKRKYAVRRLTPTEAERLQGFPDDWTNLGTWTDSKGKTHKYADSNRYKALGNSIALPFWDYLAKNITEEEGRTITVGSLFDGIGGFPFVFEKYNGKGTARWASEIEEFPIAVTKKHFPNMVHVGDITKLNGAELEPVDVLVGGSPCQDLSVAGKRCGFEGDRSSLFREQIRIIREMKEESERRIRTTGDGRVSPSWCIWENVVGAFSSGKPKGADFQEVLNSFIRICEPNAPSVPIPKQGWPKWGSIVGDGFSLCYRTHDAQFWGVAQRRRRISVVLHITGQSAKSVLFKPESLQWHNKSCYSEGQGFTPRVEGGTGVPSEQPDSRSNGVNESH